MYKIFRGYKKISKSFEEMKKNLSLRKIFVTYNSNIFINFKWNIWDDESKIYTLHLKMKCLQTSAEKS